MDTLLYLTSLAVGLLLNEAVDISPWLARKVIRWAAHRLPSPDLARDYEEEWTALLSERPGKLLKLAYALSFVVPALTMRRELQGRPSWPQRLLRRHVALWTGPRMPWGLMLGLAAMGCMITAERIPQGPDTDTLFYWVSGTGAALMTYVSAGMATASRALRRLSARARAGDVHAQRQMQELYGGHRDTHHNNR
ncbi:hypothetical protein [Streptomyces europaeiscabiei]|uniref:hypothetical protein n=1 Tax=Streptomyces europaeiscabiei TaxID=146819 RepID=UPI0029A08D3A|nr:hypothetical protein [Streptomyces europaeiscabiei]MDX3588939.1 hypothetical protein [Streptomyces europaeiscabiei]